MICRILSRLSGTEYFPDGLTLSGNISRREYRCGHSAAEFMKDYSEKLNLNVEKSLDNKNILVTDDVITDGNTLQTVCEKIKESYPTSHLFAATCGILQETQRLTIYC